MKKIFSVLLLLSIVLLCACASSKPDETIAQVSSTGDNGNGTSASTEVSTAVETTEADILTAEEIYSAFLNKLSAKLRYIIVDDTHLDGFSEREGMVGIAEIAVNRDLDLMEKMGYLLRDLNDDGTPELIICQVDSVEQGVFSGTRILCAYTVTENEISLLFEGHSRNRYYLLEDGSVYNEASNGAASTAFGVFTVEMGETGPAWVDFYFTDMNSEQQLQYFHNQTGSWDISASEPVNLDTEAMGTKQAEYASVITSLELIALDTIEAE